MYVLSQVLPGVQLGGIGLDMCKSPSRAANLVANLHSGDVVLQKNGETINPSRIDAYVATMDTESTVRVADILQQLAMPQVIIVSSNVKLNSGLFVYAFFPKCFITIQLQQSTFSTDVICHLSI